MYHPWGAHCDIGQMKDTKVWLGWRCRVDLLDKGQVASEAAELYEQFFVPSLFQVWPTHLLDAMAVKQGDRVLDIACGTGVLARTAVDRVGSPGLVTGLDFNEGMLAVARRVEDRVEWKFGQAEDLPFPDNHFDAVGCQFGLMFFDDRQAAIREMVRVLKPAGMLAVAVWDSVDHNPAFGILIGLLDELCGKQVGDKLRAPFSVGDTGSLQAIFASAGFLDAKLSTLAGKCRFPTIQDWIFTNVKAWTLFEDLDDKMLALLDQKAQTAFQGFTAADGRVEFDSSAHIMLVQKR
jgi:ubiquinone/menaquinone biosynthesis C-methylase UbiE